MELFVLGVFLGAILGMFLMACLSINAVNEYEKVLKETTLQNSKIMNDNLEVMEENRQLRSLRLEEIRKNGILDAENRQMKKLLNQIADLTIQYLIGHEKDLINKIKELVRDYQSKN